MTEWRDEPLPGMPTRTYHPDFDGATYEQARDGARLNAQLTRVLDAVSTGHWYTLANLREKTGDPEASISARLRDLRKGKFGGYTIEKRNEGKGTWYYRLVVAEVPPSQRPVEPVEGWAEKATAKYQSMIGLAPTPSEPESSVTDGIHTPYERIPVHVPGERIFLQ